MIDKIDKEIIRLLLKYKGRSLTTNQIAIKSGIAPLTARRHLDKLEKDNLVESKKSRGIKNAKKN